MARQFPKEKALTILIDAYLIGDKEAIAKYGISSRTIWLWRQRFAEDPDFRAEFLKRQAAISLAWLEYAPRALIAGLTAFQKIAERGTEGLSDDSAVPAFTRELAGAMKTISSMTIAQKYSDAKLKMILKQLESTDDQPAFLPDSPPNQISDGGYVNGQTIDVEPEQ